MEDNKKIELLCPAGSIDSFYAAVNLGADAVYMGLSDFNARKMTQNFTNQEYISCIKYAHARGVKIYLTLNTLIYDDEMEIALEIVSILYENGLDAVIVQDIGLAMQIKKLFPNLHIHASTQMSIYSLGQVKYLEKIGFKRVVLARELSILEIEEICNNTTMEIEVFVHGALCMSVSGKCLLSAVIGNRSANRGSCAQPCRMKYSLYEDTKNTPVYTGKYLLSKKDIYGLEHIDKLIKAGVKSLKIEGRNKGVNYVAATVSTYRKHIDDAILKDTSISKEELKQDRDNLMQVFCRTTPSVGFLDGVQKQDSITKISPKNTGMHLGEVIDKKSCFVKVKLLQDIDMHDGIEIYSEEKVVSNIVTCIKNDRHDIVNKEAKKGDIVFLGDIKESVKIGSSIYKTSSKNLNSMFVNMVKDTKCQSKKTVYIHLDIKIDSVTLKANIEVFDKIFIADILEKDLVSVAKNKPIVKEDIVDVFSKDGNSTYKFDIVDLKIEDNLFISRASLNEIRRKVSHVLEDKIIKSYEREPVRLNIPNELEKVRSEYLSNANTTTFGNNISNTLYVYTYDNKADYIEYYKNRFGGNELENIYIHIQDYMENILSIQKLVSKVNIFIVVPEIGFSGLKKHMEISNLEKILGAGIKGFILGTLEYVEVLLELKKKYKFFLASDYGLNVTNVYSAMVFKNIGFDVVTLSYEISSNQINYIAKFVPVQLVNDYINATVSRYCILGSFVSKANMCSGVCKMGNYYLKDSYGLKFNIVSKNLDCIMYLVKNIRNVETNANCGENQSIELDKSINISIRRACLS